MPMNPKHWIECPECNVRLERDLAVIQSHYRKGHRRIISEGDAYKVASPQRKGKTPYTEGLKKSYREVSGGLPSLGKNSK